MRADGKLLSGQVNREFRSVWMADYDWLKLTARRQGQHDLQMSKRARGLTTVPYGPTAGSLIADAVERGHPIVDNLNAASAGSPRSAPRTRCDTHRCRPSARC
jgi:hypothetical protein